MQEIASNCESYAMKKRVSGLTKSIILLLAREFSAG